MNIFDKIFSQLGYEKASRLAELLEKSLTVDRYGKSQPKNYEQYLKAYADELWVYACVFTVANAIAGLPYRFYYKVREKGVLVKKPAMNRNLEELDALMQKPNTNDENSTWDNLIEFTVASMELTGNSYWLLDDPNNPTSIQQLISSKVRIKPGTDKFIENYLYTVSGTTEPKPYKPEEILHFKYMSVNNYWYGQSSLSPARWSIETNKEALKTNLKIFRNGARLDFALLTEQALNDKNYDRLEKKFAHKYSGTDNAHKVPVFEKGLKAQTISGTLKDLEFLGGMKMTREEMCAAFNVPPLIVGILDKATYSNYKESMKIFWKIGQIPKIKKIEPVITELARRFDPEVYFEFDLSNVEALKEDEKLKSEIAKNYFSIGIPVNDIIEKLDLRFNKVEGGDVGYLPMTLIPMGSPAPAPEASRSKTINIMTEERKDILWKRYEQLTTKIENVYKKVIESFFMDQKNDMLARMGKSKAEIDIESVLFNEKGEVTKWAKESRKVHTVAVEENGKRELLNLGVDVAFEVTNPRVQGFLNSYGLEKATEVVGNNRDAIKKSLIEGVREGEGIPQLKKRITEIYEPYKAEGYKAVRIARTEVIGASNAGAMEAYKQSGVVKKKGWLSTRTGDLRPEHVGAENRYAKGIPLDANFKIAGASGPAPGQMGVADQDCNCRCTIIPIVEK